MGRLSEYMESGVPGLDNILRGGLPRNQMYAVNGESGSGKTTLSMQFLLQGACAGERCLYICTSETKTEIQLIAHSHGWSLENIKIVHLLLHYTDRAGPGQTMLYPAEVELPHIVENLIKQIRDYDPQRVVIDSLSEIRLLATQESWYQRQLVLLKNFLELRACTTFLVDTIVSNNSPLKTIVHGEVEMNRIAPLYGPERRRLRIEKLRGHSFISGYHDYDIVKGGLRVYPRLISSEHPRHFRHELISSGIIELDRLMGGGIDRGTCTLLQGATGSGKSSLVTQFAYSAAQRNERSLIFCFDERISTFIERARGLGMSLEPYLADSRIILNQIDPAEISAGEFSNMVLEAVIEKNIALIIIDSINGYSYALPEERFLSVHLHELTSFLNIQGVVTLLTMNQQGGLGIPAISPTFDISYISDSVINLAFFEHQGMIHSSLTVMKRRSGYHERTIHEMIMDSQGLHIGQVLKEFEGIATGIPRYTGAESNLGKRKSF